MKSKLFAKISAKIGVTTTEFCVVMAIVLGFSVGIVGKNYFPLESENQTNISADSLKFVLDSIANIEKTRYIGTDTSNNPVPELKAADTLFYKKPPKKSDFKGIININTASKSELMKLYRIGDKMADRIIEYRNRTPFKKPEEIMNVKGIGITTYNKIKDNIRV